ncbi:MAG TPA: hypothetical protein VFK30_11540, partial [Anaerolineae bacterium]|nr:hypothetical protein [Anaerolineae bacterium]
MSVKKFLGLLFPCLIIILWGLSSRVLASQTTSPMQLTTNSPALSVSLGPSADNTLYEDQTGSLSNGAGAYFFAG